MTSRAAITTAALVLCGCGGAASSTATSPPKPPAPLPAIEMRYVASDAGGAVVVAAVVHADGRIERPSLQTATIVDRRIVCPDGTELIRVEPDGGIVFDEKNIARFSGEGAFEVAPGFGRWSVTVRDDGFIAMTTHAEGTVTSNDIRWEGFRPEARRTASLLSAMLTPAFGGRWCGVAASKM